MSDTVVLQILLTGKNKINTHYKQIINKNKNLETYLLNRFADSDSLIETIYRIWKQIYSRPVCPICGNKVKFISGSGFRETCSVSCSKKLIKEADNIITDDIIKSEYIKDGKLISKNKLQEKFLKEHNYYDYLINRYTDTNNVSESIYRICHDITELPKCKICGKPCRFTGIEIGYDNYCSYKCCESDKVPEITDEYIKSLGLKSKITDINWSGHNKVELYLRNKFGNEYRDFHEAVYMVIHDMEHIPVCPVCGNRIKFNHNYYDNAKYSTYCSKSCDNKHRYNNLVNKISRMLNTRVEMVNNDKFIIYDYCDKHDRFELTYRQIHNRIGKGRYKHTVICPICNPERNKETSIETIIKNILDELNIDYKQHDRKLISPKELDFYIPEYNIAIECNGMFWHSEKKKDELYHYNKMKLCGEKGIRLLSFWEYDIYNNTEKIKNIISSICQRNKKIYARLCTVKEITSKESRKFIDKYHLQGNINAKIKLGLFYNDKLVEVMTFGIPRNFMKVKHDKDDYELYRLCSKSGYSVIGGASKLLNYFKTHYKWKSIISYCMSDISDGNVYKTLGFEFDRETKYGYFYYNFLDDKVVNRYKLAKYKINDGSGKKTSDIIADLGYIRCNTSGTRRYTLKNIKNDV